MIEAHREDAQAFWDAFAAGREPNNDAAIASLAVFGNCPIYDAYRDRAERAAVRSLIASPDHSWRVLDIGCGPGRWTVPFAKACNSVTAMDFSSPMLEHARKYCEKAGVSGKVDFQNGRVEELDVSKSGGPFDLVLAMGVLQYVSDDKLESVCARIASNVKSKGLLLNRETRSPKPVERHYTSSESPLAMRSYYRPFETYSGLFQKFGLSLQDRRSVLPPNLAYSCYAKTIGTQAKSSCSRGILRAIVCVHETLIDPVWRLFPAIMWRANSRRATDMGIALYRKL